MYESTLVKAQKQQKRINWLQTNLNPQRLLATTIADIKHQDPFSIAWFTMHEGPLPIWALYSHTAYIFAKMFNPIMANESRFKASETSLTFPADNVNTKQQIEITMVENCLEDNIIKISKSCRKHKQLEPIENCIFIPKQSLDKLLKVCIQTLNTVLLPPKEDLNLTFGCYASRMLKAHSSGMLYFIDITQEQMGRVLDFSVFFSKLCLTKQA